MTQVDLNVVATVCLRSLLRATGDQVFQETCAYRKPHTHGSRGRPALAQGRRAQPA